MKTLCNNYSIILNGINKKFSSIFVYKSNLTLSTLQQFNSASSGKSERCCFIKNSTINDNIAELGAGINIDSSSPIIFDNVTANNNLASYEGGALYIYNSDPIFSYSTITNNRANKGGGMFLYYADPIFLNVTLSRNTAAEFSGDIFSDFSIPTFKNSILWYNYPQTNFSNQNNQPIIEYSNYEDVQHSY